MKNIIVQALKFFGISGIGWIIDFCVYTILGFFSENLILNNYMSSLFGVTFVFVFATRKIFKSKVSKIPIRVKYLLYILYQLFLIYLVSNLLDRINVLIIDNIEIEFVILYSKTIAKILVTPVTMLVNYIVMKNIVEKM